MKDYERYFETNKWQLNAYMSYATEKLATTDNCLSNRSADIEKDKKENLNNKSLGIYNEKPIFHSL